MDEETRRGPVTGRTWVMLVAAMLLASAVGIAIGLAINWFPAQGSNFASKIDTFWDVLLITSVPVFVLVTSIVLFSIWRWHMRPGEEKLDGPPIHGNTKLEVWWTLLPALLIASLCTYATILLLDIQEAPAKGTRVVNVTGQQFAWTFAMNEGGKVIKANKIVLPVGEEVQFKVHSKDVLHDFWVPEWRLKVDAVPGITTSYQLTPTKVGRFQVVCAELCGLGHAFMRQFITVGTRSDFAAWVRAASGPAAGAAPAGGAAPAVDAKALFTGGNPSTGATACGACHTLSAAGTTAQTGPVLDKVLKGWDAARIREAIANPNKDIAKGFGANIMPPNYQQTLSAAQLDALVNYLEKSVNG
jgi:cytochrome c oxidase subunit II